MNKLLVEAAEIIRILRDFHDQHCEHMTCCGDSVEADRVATELDDLAGAEENVI